VRALAAAREAGAKTALITAAGNTPARDIADVVLMTPLRDKSYCHTVGYTSPMLTGFYLASAYREEEFPAAALAGYLRELLTMRSHALEIGRALDDQFQGVVVAAETRRGHPRSVCDNKPGHPRHRTVRQDR
jgi:fructoselysine-6-P-deglycase FrlB-like protein